MKKRKKLILIILLALLVTSNLPPVQYFFQENYHYMNQDGSFQFTEFGSHRNFEVAKKQFSYFKSQNPENPNRTLFRTFTIKPWRFWEWWQMIRHHERFTLPLYQGN